MLGPCLALETRASGWEEREAAQRQVCRDVEAAQEGRSTQPLPPPRGSGTSTAFTPTGQGQIASSAERHRAVKTRSAGKMGAGDTGLGEPAATRKPQGQDWVQLPREKAEGGTRGAPGTRRQGKRLGKGRDLKDTTVITEWSPQPSA